MHLLLVGLLRLRPHSLLMLMAAAGGRRLSTVDGLATDFYMRLLGQWSDLHPKSNNNHFIETTGHVEQFVHDCIKLPPSTAHACD